MASRSMHLALCFLAFCGQIRDTAVYRADLPEFCTQSFKQLEASTLKDMPTVSIQKRMQTKGLEEK